MIIDRVYELLGGSLTSGPGQTQQVRCLLKGFHSNEDRKKSARIYADTDKYFCYTCLEHPLRPWELYARVKDLSKDQAIAELKKLGLDAGVEDKRISEEDRKIRRTNLLYFSKILRENRDLAISEIRKFYKVA